MCLSKNLKYLRLKNGYSQDYIADMFTYKSYTTIQKWENGDAEPSVEKLKTLAELYKITMNELLTTDIENGKSDKDEQIYHQLDMSFIKVPLYDSISCGSGGFVDDNIIDYVSVPDSSLNRGKEYFAQKAKGDSMINVGILEDTICIFEKTDVIEDGKIGCFCIDEGIATCKKFKKGPSFIQLLPMNNNYDPIVIDLHNANFRVLGVLKTSIKNWE